MSRTRILEKIAKCMALSASDNPGEAAAAVRQAQKLMAKHNLTASDLDLHTVRGIESEKITPTKVPPMWVAMLRDTIASAFEVQQIWQVQRRKGIWRNRVVFIGIGEKPDAAAYCYEVLYRQIQADRGVFSASLPAKMTKHKKASRCHLYCEAWVSGVYQKIEMFAMTEKDDQLIRRFKEVHYGDLPKAEMRDDLEVETEADKNAMRQGYSAGESANLFVGVPVGPGNSKISQG